MHHKPAITIADDVDRGLYQKVGRGEMSRFIENLVRPHVVADIDLEAAYRAMADQIRTVATERLSGQVGTLTHPDLLAVEQAIRLQLGLP